MKIDHEIESRGAQAAGQLEIVAEALDAARPIQHDQRVEIRMMTDHWLGGCFDKVCESRVRKAPLQRADGRRREDDVADQPQADEQDVVDGRYGSIFASSMSITGMSSLMGYTRWHDPHLSAVPSFTSVTGVLQAGQARISSSSASTGIGEF